MPSLGPPGRGRELAVDVAMTVVVVVVVVVVLCHPLLILLLLFESLQQR